VKPREKTSKAQTRTCRKLDTRRKNDEIIPAEFGLRGFHRAQRITPKMMRWAGRSDHAPPKVLIAMDTLLTAFIAVTAAAVVVQMLILFGMFIAMRKMAGRIEALAEKVEDTTSVVQVRVMPLLENAKAMQEQVKGFIETERPKIEALVENVTEISSDARATVERLQVTVNDALDRARLQVIRGDEMLTRTMNRLEETSERVQQTVMSPVRQVSGLMQAISTGVGTYFNQQKRRRNGGPSDEMFI